jgi:hypothetical protein
MPTIEDQMHQRPAATRFPDGVGEPHLARTSVTARPLSWLILFLLAGLMLAALLGLFGGGAKAVSRAHAPEATFSLTAPGTLRNGEFFEFLIRVDAKQAIAKPTIAIPSSYWRDITINTIEPAPGKEVYEGDAMTFSFDRLDPGDTLLLKIDGQINPALFGGNEGTFELRDDKRTLAAIPRELTVCP